MLSRFPLPALAAALPHPWAGKELLAFTGAPHAWYVEMYIGLFLLILFLNVLYHGLTSRRQKQVLILTLLAVTALPALTNLYHSCFPPGGRSCTPLPITCWAHISANTSPP